MRFTRTRLVAGLAALAVATMTLAGPPARAETATVTVTPKQVVLFRGAEQQLTVTLTSPTAAPRDVTSGSQFASTNTAVAQVKSAGLISSLAEGQTDIVVTWNNYTVRVPVTVRPPAPMSMTITAPDRLLVAESAQLTAVETWSDGRKVDVTSEAIWTVSAPEVLYLDQSTRKAFGRSEGTAVINAQHNYSGTTVFAQRPIKVERHPTTLSLSTTRTSGPLPTRQYVTYTATLRNTPIPAGINGEQVTIKLADGTVPCTLPKTSNGGVASCTATYTLLAPAPKAGTALTGTFAGTSFYLPSTAISTVK